MQKKKWFLSMLLLPALLSVLLLAAGCPEQPIEEQPIEPPAEEPVMPEDMPEIPEDVE